MSVVYEAADRTLWGVVEIWPFDHGASILLFHGSERVRWCWGHPIAWKNRENLDCLFRLSRPFSRGG